MKFVFATDSFKGSLTSEEAEAILASALKKVIPDAKYISIPTADGGEGTAEAIRQARKGTTVTVEAHDPLFRPIQASYVKLDHEQAVIEAASASGLTLLANHERDPLEASSYGTGEIIRKALADGSRDLYIALGGSATNDGGIGALKALGVRFLDENGSELEGRGKDLEKIAAIDESQKDPLLEQAKITILSDVMNPLCGKNGATYTFGRQKGGTEEKLNQLERGMLHYRDLLKRQYRRDADRIQGAGAAGGMGAGFAIVLNAEIRSGISVVLDLSGFDDQILDADYVITGEGRTDWQSSYGKVLQGIGERCEKYQIPVIAISGSTGEGYEEIYSHGISYLFTTSDPNHDLMWNMSHARDLYYQTALSVFTMIHDRK